MVLNNLYKYIILTFTVDHSSFPVRAFFYFKPICFRPLEHLLLMQEAIKIEIFSKIKRRFISCGMFSSDEIHLKGETLLVKSNKYLKQI